MSPRGQASGTPALELRRPQLWEAQRPTDIWPGGSQWASCGRSVPAVLGAGLEADSACRRLQSCRVPFQGSVYLRGQQQ